MSGSWVIYDKEDADYDKQGNNQLRRNWRDVKIQNKNLRWAEIHLRFFSIQLSPQNG